ncbi:hypothetical protein E4U42_002556 [Claviceps africana]|uniref:Uncharacterized protein n=1 Tax=Claviceps africana TaxID=83212 RepID=A0A8K0NII4_9HYPO|nr:hypothetical protein E4U42_002556 [Claviceps africana]
MRLSIFAVLATVALADQTPPQRLPGCGKGLIFGNSKVYQHSIWCQKTQNVFNCDHNTRLTFDDKTGMFLFESPEVDYVVEVVCPDQTLNTLFHCTAGYSDVFSNPCGQTTDGVTVSAELEGTPPPPHN